MIKTEVHGLEELSFSVLGIFAMEASCLPQSLSMAVTAV